LEDKEGLMWNKLKALLKDEEGLTTVEIILILVVLIALVLIFKEQMTEIVNNIFKTITSQSNKILK
jgi:Flp pilus assembly pilin Flp